ncbi:hypothetical protein GTO10_02415 [Candidatus Saccharibacteria bacterium]|nr:hypothetical protein [Candidatus Saccharibacteria bacterium]
MSDTILGGDITVYYSDENRRKQLVWTGGATTTHTLNEVYSALANLFDELGQMDDGSVMSAETPVEYTIGIIDAGDSDPWYVTYDCMEHITSGALRTSSWTRQTGTNTGIVVVPVTAATNTIVTGDVGNDISGATTGNGTLLEVIDIGATDDYLVIRPNSSVAGDDFTTNGQTITEAGSSHTATQSGASSFTGEQIWANLYSIGTIEPDTHIYLYQGTVSDASRARISSITDSTQDWWGDGHIDICVYTKDFTQASFPIIDGGYIKAFARKGSTYYDNFETATSTTSGGRNPVPINTATDLDNSTGYKSITTTAVATDDFNVGDEINGATSGARAIITQIDGSSPTYTFHYYLLGDPQTDFQTAAETVTDVDATGSATKDGNAPANQGPALNSWFTNNTPPTVTHANTTFDVDDDGTAEYYGITIDCNQNPLSEVYEWLKYITRNGGTTTANTDGIEGEQYVGAEAYLAYTGAVTGSINEGSDVTQETSGATGIVISHDTTNKVILLRDVRGTFGTGATTYTLTDNDTSGTVEIDSAAANFAPNKQVPFGSFPGGGTFFGARGVLLTDYVSADENNFSLVSVDGGTYTRPQAYSITVTQLVGTNDQSVTTDDRVTVFRLTAEGGNIDKTEFSASGGESIGDATLTVDTAIPADVPGKTTGGVLRIRDASDNNANYRIRFSSWSGSVFTLANATGTATAGTNTTTIVDSGASFNTTARRGDLVYNTTGGGAGKGYSYVASVDSDTQLTLTSAISGQISGDSYELNCVPIAMNTADDVYIPLIDQYATGSTASVSIIYVSPIYFRARVRNVANPTPIKPFEVDSVLSGANTSVQTVRTEDTIYT